MKKTTARIRFGDILRGSRCVVPASVYDPISARLAEGAGYELGVLGGSVASLAVLGAPDLMLLTMTELVEQTRRITRATDLPILVDADHGYGNALNVRRTIEELEAAGAAGVTIEDTELPRPFNNDGTPGLISIDEGVGKMRAALSARSDANFAIAARTNAAKITGVADTIARCNAYEAVGVDAVFVTGLTSEADLEMVSSKVKAPLILGSSGLKIGDGTRPEERGVRIMLKGNAPILAAVAAIQEAYSALRSSKSPAISAGAVTMSLATKNTVYDGWIGSFLTNESI